MVPDQTLKHLDLNRNHEIHKPKLVKWNPNMGIKWSKWIPGRSEIRSGGGEEGDRSPVMLRSNLVLSQLLRQIRTRYHIEGPPLTLEILCVPREIRKLFRNGKSAGKKLNWRSSECKTCMRASASVRCVDSPSSLGANEKSNFLSFFFFFFEKTNYYKYYYWVLNQKPADLTG